MSLRAITREVSANINDCELTFHTRQPIDISRAIAQHQAYQESLLGLGVKIVSLPPEPQLPDAVFVEDAALVFDEVALLTHMGAPSRRPEVSSVAAVLSRYRPLKFLTEPATLDGGDVLRIGRSVLVGLSRRTNRAGVEQLRELLQPYDYEVVPVAVTGCLHFKSACSCVDKDKLLVNRSWIDLEPLRGFELLEVAAEEPAGANVLAIENVVIMPDSFPRTRALLERKGSNVRAIDVSELQKAEAGVTCCSLIFNDCMAGSAKSSLSFRASTESVFVSQTGSAILDSFTHEPDPASFRHSGQPGGGGRSDRTAGLGREGAGREQPRCPGAIDRSHDSARWHLAPARDGRRNRDGSRRRAPLP